MKTIMILLVATFATVTAFSQKSKADSANKNSSTATVHYTCSMHPDVFSDKPGDCPYCNAKLVIDRRGTKQGATIYTCTMHPNVMVTKAGKCPICGMTLQVKSTQSDSSKTKM
jgi:putative DNA topoisomerase